MAAASITRLLITHPGQENRNPGITIGSITGRTKLSRVEGGARLTGASDSSKAVSGRSPGSTANPPKTPASSNRTNSRWCRRMPHHPKWCKATPATIRMSNGAFLISPRGKRFSISSVNKQLRILAIGLASLSVSWRNIAITLKIPLQIAEGANRRRKLVLTPGFSNYR
jgi:hypothetical protein